MPNEQGHARGRITQGDVILIILIGTSPADPNQLILEEDVFVVVIGGEGLFVERDEQLVAAIRHPRRETDVDVSRIL